MTGKNALNVRMGIVIVMVYLPCQMGWHMNGSLPSRNPCCNVLSPNAWRVSWHLVPYTPGGIEEAVQQELGLDEGRKGFA